MQMYELEVQRGPLIESITAYNSFLTAYELTRKSSKLKSDLYCTISIECQQKGVNRLFDEDLEKVCWWWLSSIGYHNIKTMEN